MRRPRTEERARRQDQSSKRGLTNQRPLQKSFFPNRWNRLLDKKMRLNKEIERAFGSHKIRIHLVFANFETWTLGVYHGLRKPHLQNLSR